MTSPTDEPRPLAWWQRPFDGGTLTIVAMFSGALLWESFFPGFYYMAFVYFVVMLWSVLAAVLIIRLLIAGVGAGRTGRPVAWTGCRGVLALVSVVSVVILLKLPLHAGFALARADFDLALQQDQQPGETFSLSRYLYGIYPIRQQASRRCHREDRIYFALANDAESAFVYSESGIDDLCYNSGSKGHLSGNWYWMAED